MGLEIVIQPEQNERFGGAGGGGGLGRFMWGGGGGHSTD